MVDKIFLCIYHFYQKVETSDSTIETSSNEGESSNDEFRLPQQESSYKLKAELGGIYNKLNSQKKNSKSQPRLSQQTNIRRQAIDLINSRKSTLKTLATLRKKESINNQISTELEENLLRLRNKALQIEHRTPLLQYKPTDDILQIKHFIMSYYGPVLS